MPAPRVWTTVAPRRPSTRFRIRPGTGLSLTASFPSGYSRRVIPTSAQSSTPVAGLPPLGATKEPLPQVPGEPTNEQGPLCMLA